jgi:glycosyltransferase involved in cell wall biosynthesis
VFVQNPSLVLVLYAVVLRPVLRYRLVMDAHNAGVYPSEGGSPMLQRLADWLLKRVDLVIVTNDGLAERVRAVGGRPFVLPDPLPDLAARRELTQVLGELPITGLFICTWAADEPYFEVFKAAELLPDIRFLVTGNSKGREIGYGSNVPRNVILTGYVPHEEYERLLTTCDFVLDLTTRQDCLVCGAYESVAVGTPFVLSDSKALRSYFRMGGTYVSNDAVGIANGIRALMNDYETYRAQIARLKGLLESEWAGRKNALTEMLADFQ